MNVGWKGQGFMEPKKPLGGRVSSLNETGENPPFSLFDCVFRSFEQNIFIAFFYSDFENLKKHRIFARVTISLTHLLFYRPPIETCPRNHL